MKNSVKLKKWKKTKWWYSKMDDKLICEIGIGVTIILTFLVGVLVGNISYIPLQKIAISGAIVGAMLGTMGNIYIMKKGGSK